MAASSVWKKVGGVFLAIALVFLAYNYVKTKFFSDNVVANQQAGNDSQKAADLPSVPRESQMLQQRPAPQTFAQSPASILREVEQELQQELQQENEGNSARSKVPMVSDLPKAFSDGSPIRRDIKYDAEFKAGNIKLMAKIRSPYVIDEEKQKAIAELADRPSAGVAKFLATFIEEDRNYSHRLEAIRSLGEVGNLSYSPLLEHLISNGDPAVQEAAKEALGKIMKRANPSQRPPLRVI